MGLGHTTKNNENFVSACTGGKYEENGSQRDHVATTRKYVLNGVPVLWFRCMYVFNSVHISYKACRFIMEYGM